MKNPELPIYRYYNIVVKRGNDEEKRALLTELGLLSALKREFPGSVYQPMEQVQLISSLCEQADQLGEERFRNAHRQHFRDHQGKVGRTLEEEQATTRGQFALQVMLGLPLGEPTNYQDARRLGNAGGKHDAFLPLHNPFRHHLIIDPRTMEDVTCWLIVSEGGSHYRLKGWITSDRGKQKKYFTRRAREGGWSEAYWVPPGDLNSVESWWEL